MAPRRTRTLVVAGGALAQTIEEALGRADPSNEVMRAAPDEALDAVDRLRPDVVLLGAHGALLKALRAQAAELPIVAIVTNDLGESNEGTHALDEGATDVIVERELEPRLLVWRLRLAIDRHDAEKRLRDAKQMAESANERKSEFLASMSHEIRTPLNTVLGMAELLAETALDDHQRGYMNTLQRASDHVLALIEDVLDLARIEAGTVTMEDVGFDLYEVAESAIELVRVQAKRKKLELGWGAERDVPRVLRGDPRRVRQVLVNLLSNAVKFTSAGRVWLSIARDEAVSVDDAHAPLRLDVSDTGIGVPHDKLGAIFTGFVQGDGTIERRYGGFGLGLNIAKRIVERMNGRIWVESREGNGSTFHVAIAFPIERGTVTPTFTPTKHTGSMKIRTDDGRRLRVLVVDDSEDNRVLLGEYLRGAGVDVDFADDGPSALDKGTTEIFDVVLMDLQMPQLDGYATTRELLRRFRQAGTKAPPVIALSAHVLSESFARSLDAGASMQLTKPIRKRVLLEAVARAAGAHAVESREAGRGPLRDEIRPLLPKFFANRRNDVRVLREALQRGDYHTIATLSHNMRGTGASYGFPEISAVGDGLEVAGKRQETDEILHLVDDLEALLDDLEERYVPASKLPASGTRVRATAPAQPTGTHKH